MDKQIKNIFLSGCMSYYYNHDKPNLAEDWRNEAIEKLGDKFNIFNPCKNYNKNKYYDSKGVVYQNLAYLNKSDIVILNADNIEKSPGTLFEIFTSFLNHKSVISFGGNNSILEQPHVKESITVHFDTLDEVCDYIRNMYCQ
jgi:nucleoside 2-deoxyribosyltransferase